MRIVSSALAGFIAVCTATSVTSTSKPDSNGAFDNVVPSEPTRFDGHWWIGCDENNYCSYYQNTAVATSIAASRSARADGVNNVECQGCTDDRSCHECQPSVFKCVDCQHFQCADESMKSQICIDMPLERSTRIDNGTSTVPRNVELPKVNKTSPIVATDRNTERLAQRGQNISLPDKRHPIFGRHAAFSDDQCVNCDPSECSECHSNCPEFQHFKCVNLTTRLSMFISVRPKSLVPCDPVPPPVSIVTTTVYFLPVLTSISASTTRIKLTPRSVVTDASPASPSVVKVSVVVTKTTTVYTLAPTETITTKFVEVSFITVTHRHTLPSSALVTKPIAIASGDRFMPPKARMAGPPDPSRTITNVVRATQVSELLPPRQYNTMEASCKGCNFVCPECGSHMLCESPYSGSYLCVEILGNTNALQVHDASTASDKSLGDAAMLLVPQDAEAVVAANLSNNAQAMARDGVKTALSFNLDHCHNCTRGDAACSGCNWKFMCSSKIKCSESFGANAIELCWERGKLCAA